jgi:hypothetical protein
MQVSMSVTCHSQVHPQSDDAESDEANILPLDLVFKYGSLSIENLLMIIEAYPAALQHENIHGYLPVHVESLHECRASIIAKCIELYPESLHMPSCPGDFLLHCCQSNESSSVEVALMLMEKYPAELQHTNKYDDLPIHLECKKQCRVAVIRRCFEIYPHSVMEIEDGYIHPMELILWRIGTTANRYNTHRFIPVLSFLVQVNPIAFVELVCSPRPNSSSLENYDLRMQRILMNLISGNMLSEEMRKVQRNFNWHPRSSLLYLMLQLVASVQKVKSADDKFKNDDTMTMSNELIR